MKGLLRNNKRRQGVSKAVRVRSLRLQYADEEFRIVLRRTVLSPRRTVHIPCGACFFCSWVRPFVESVHAFFFTGSDTGGADEDVEAPGGEAWTLIALPKGRMRFRYVVTADSIVPGLVFEDCGPGAHDILHLECRREVFLRAVVEALESVIAEYGIRRDGENPAFRGPARRELPDCCGPEEFPLSACRELREMLNRKGG